MNKVYLLRETFEDRRDPLVAVYETRELAEIAASSSHNLEGVLRVDEHNVWDGGKNND